MDYHHNDDYRAYRLKLAELQRELAGRYDSTLSKLGMFAEDAFIAQQQHIDALRGRIDSLMSLLTSTEPSHEKEPPDAS